MDLVKSPLMDSIKLDKNSPEYKEFLFKLAEQKKEPKFHFAIGRPKHPNQDSNVVCFYMEYGEIRYGTMVDAVALRDYCNMQTDTVKYGHHKIYILSELDEETNGTY